jgi:hypothetical protein
MKSYFKIQQPLQTGDLPIITDALVLAAKIWKDTNNEQYTKATDLLDRIPEFSYSPVEAQFAMKTLEPFSSDEEETIESNIMADGLADMKWIFNQLCTEYPTMGILNTSINSRSPSTEWLVTFNGVVFYVPFDKFWEDAKNTSGVTHEYVQYVEDGKQNIIFTTENGDKMRTIRVQQCIEYIRQQLDLIKNYDARS